MDYKESWTEMKQWMAQGIEYLQQRLKDLEGREDFYAQKEYVRLQGKLDGLRTSYEHMHQSEKIYGGDK